MGACSGIDPLLEGFEADTAIGVEEGLAVAALTDVDLKQGIDHFRDLLAAEGGAEDLTQRRFVALGATQRDLVPLLALLVDAEDADLAHVVVAAGVHAAGDIELQRAEVVEEVEVVEAL